MKMSCCLVCGELARGHCATCTEATYCSREHQNVHWIQGGHRYACYDHREDPLLELELDLENAHPLVARNIDSIQRRIGEDILRKNDSARARDWLRYNHIEAHTTENIEGIIQKAKDAWRDFKEWRKERKRQNRKRRNKKQIFKEDEDE